ncbi:MAG: hypothetical protein HF973_09330 [Chloroflexi bacterium]|nr:hypothetical protein [Chloroflexota bacterium]
MLICLRQDDLPRASAVVGALAQGGIIPANAVLFSVAGSVLATAVVVIIALRMFNRERLLYSM